MTEIKKTIIYIVLSLLVTLAAVGWVRVNDGREVSADRLPVAGDASVTEMPELDHDVQEDAEEGDGSLSEEFHDGDNHHQKAESTEAADSSGKEAHDEAWYAAEHVISHRGASAEEVEHTFAAYDLAIAYGSHYIEQDLVLSGDRTLYVSHDDSAERIAGVDRLFSEMTDEEIDILRTANGEKIHTLQEVFDRYGKDTNYVIELKDGASQVEAFISLIEENGMEEHVIVQDFEPEPLERLEAVFPHMPKLRLCREEEDMLSGIDEPYSDIICVKYTLLSQENCDKVQNAGKKFAVYWSGKAEEDVAGAICIGVDCYFTNNTREAIGLEMRLRAEK